MVEGKTFLMKPKHQFIYPNEHNEFMVANHEKKEDYCVNPCLSKLTNKLWFQKIVGREAFLTKPRHQCHLSQWREWVYDSHSWKERRLLRESIFIQIDKWNLIPKNSGRGAFLTKPKHQCHLSYWGEWVYDSQPWKEKRLLRESIFI